MKIRCPYGHDSRCRVFSAAYNEQRVLVCETCGRKYIPASPSLIGLGCNKFTKRTIDVCYYKLYEDFSRPVSRRIDFFWISTFQEAAGET